jgi:cyclophilin family peptidyl-prolyl cis-trans isomerase
MRQSVSETIWWSEVETDLGTFVIALLPEVAPNHVAYFLKLAEEGGRTSVPRSTA